ncbi:hypothetical protein Tco_0541464 [Tanacetum coccineum]
MLAPSGGGLILYQAYGNLYAMTGRKAHLLEDKQISGVGVFDEVFSIWKAFRGNTRDLGSFGEETNKTTDLHQNLLKIMLIERGDGVTSIKRHRHDLRSDGVSTLVTPSERGRPKETLEDFVSRDQEDHFTSARSSRYCFDHKTFIRTRILTIQLLTRSERENLQPRE